MRAEGMTSFAFEADADLEVPSVEDFKIKARIGKTSGLFQDMILNVESFHIAGKIRCVFEADKKAEFPHLTVGDVCFVENPLVDVQCRILRDKVNVSQLPVAKQIMEKYIAIGFKQLLVFPGKQHIDFTPTPLPGPEWEGLRGCGLSQGVLTVRIECENIELVKKTLMSNYYCKLKFGSQKCLRECTNGDISSWTSTFSFLVHDPSEELLNVKLMGRRKMFQNTCVAKQKINLLTLGIIHKEQNVSKKSQVRLSTDDGSIQLLLSLYYSPLPEFSLLNHQHHMSSIIHDNSTQDAGVLYIHIHSAVNLMNRSSKSYDPYCIVKWGDKDVFQTHVVNNTRNPVWEKGIEILVPSCHNVPLSFNVYSNRTLASHDHLGVTFLTLHTDFTHLLQHRLYLDGTRHAFSPTSPAIFVSMVFRNVESVRWSWESQQEAFIQRSRRQSSSAHLNTSGKFLNPVSNGRILSQMSDSLEESYIDDESSDD
jgi:Ca2+-dependent lipid-binding protein